MNIERFLREIPKVETHCHIGATPQLLVEMAKRNNIPLPSYEDLVDLYNNVDSLEKFLIVYSSFCHAMISIEDFQQVVYTTLEAAAEDNVRYREMAWNPTVHMDIGVPFETQIAGIYQGIKDAEADFGIVCRMVAAINRENTVDRALELIQILFENRSDFIIGVGLDFNEEGNPPDRFKEPFRIVKEAGFGCTAHEGEFSTGSSEIADCLNILKCDRIDHGYRVILDETFTKRCAEKGVHFGVVPAFQGESYIPKLNGEGYDPIPIKRMVEAGLKVSLNSDDPHFSGIGPADSYILAHKEMGFSPDQFLTFVINGIDGSFLDDHTKRRWKTQWTKDIKSLIDQVRK